MEAGSADAEESEEGAGVAGRGGVRRNFGGWEHAVFVLDKQVALLVEEGDSDDESMACGVLPEDALLGDEADDEEGDAGKRNDDADDSDWREKKLSSARITLEGSPTDENARFACGSHPRGVFDRVVLSSEKRDCEMRVVNVWSRTEPGTFTHPSA